MLALTATSYPELFMDRGKTVTQCKPRGNPFRPRSIGLYLVGRHPIRSNGDGSHGPGLNVTSTSLCPQPPGLASRSGSQEGKAGAIRKPAHRNAPVSKSRDVRINPSDRTFDNPGYAYLPARNGERDRSRFRAIAGEGHGGIAPARGTARLSRCATARIIRTSDWLTSSDPALIHRFPID